MTADVYAGDDDLHSMRQAVALVPATIRIRADAEPDVLFRIAAQLNLLNCVPTHFELTVTADGEVVVEVVVRNCTRFAVDMVCRKLDQLTSVLEVACEHA